MSTYTYLGSGMSAERERRITDQEWAEYQYANRKARQRYGEDKVTVDARYNPTGGGNRWISNWTKRKKKTDG